MSVVRLKPGTWPVTALSPDDAQQAVSSGAGKMDEASRRDTLMRRLCWWVGGTGLLAGLLGIAGGGAVLLRAEPVQNHYSLIDGETGVIHPAIPASDAPKLFTNETARHHLRLMIEACASYVPDIRTQTYARCLAFMGPQAALKYRDLFTASNPDSPQRIIGQGGTLTPENIRPSPMPSSGSRWQVWVVRYNQVVRRPNAATASVPWEAQITFEWRPEVRRSAEDRDWNLGGMRIADFTFIPERATSR